ncbi:Protein of unknown function [Modicisalibacter muralis]|uniref:DUF4235 domain-containing protein n=1 Tax=Modicisalibacter muralis TaxID=119000 RepID=A0A1G9QYW4_9GAMM|nr:DUF4235 domain-containing protein [Halomonas muralis]SDM16143.1 Protein of unknown function [Halomonas muralis]
MKEETLWTLVSSGVAIAAGVAARNSMQKTYQRKIGKPPLDTYDADVGWRHALLWGAASGVLVGMARIVGQRIGSEAMHRAKRSRRGRRLLRRLES